MSAITIAISAFITIFSCGLFLVSLLSYRRHRSNKLLLISIVFLLFLIKGLILSIGLFYEQEIFAILSSLIFIGVFDFFVLLLLFLATLRR